VSAGNSKTWLRFNLAAYHAGAITYITVLYQLRNRDVRGGLREVGGRAVGAEEIRFRLTKERSTLAQMKSQGLTYAVPAPVPQRI
jgi:hypothetical protein